MAAHGDDPLGAELFGCQDAHQPDCATSPTTATVLPGSAAAEPDQQLVIYTAEPGSPSAKALLELDAWAADHAGAASSLVRHRTGYEPAAVARFGDWP